MIVHERPPGSSPARRLRPMCSRGHVAPSPQQYPEYVLAGFPRNKFGRDFAAAGYRWTVQLCHMDSDRDGRTNGQELGDPECVWQPGLPADPGGELGFCGVAEAGGI